MIRKFFSLLTDQGFGLIVAVDDISSIEKQQDGLLVITLKSGEVKLVRSSKDEVRTMTAIQAQLNNSFPLEQVQSIDNVPPLEQIQTTVN